MVVQIGLNCVHSYWVFCLQQRLSGFSQDWIIALASRAVKTKTDVFITSNEWRKIRYILRHMKYIFLRYGRISMRAVCVVLTSTLLDLFGCVHKWYKSWLKRYHHRHFNCLNFLVFTNTWLYWAFIGILLFNTPVIGVYFYK